MRIYFVKSSYAEAYVSLHIVYFVTFYAV